MIRIVFFSLIFFVIKPGLGQEIKVFSLDEAIAFAMENNYEIINSGKDIEAAKARVLESTAMGLPQINGKIDYADNLARPTVILPGEMAGTPGQDIEVQFGTKYSTSLGATASQLIFSGQYIVGLKGSKKFLEKTTVDFFKNKIAVRQKIAESYYNVLATEEALSIIDTTYIITKNLADETRQVYEVGFAEDIDADQLDLLVADLEANRTYFQNQLFITHAYLKFYMGLNENDSLVLTDNLASLVKKWEQSNILLQSFAYNRNIEFVSMGKQKELSSLQLNLEKMAYLPTLSANIDLQTQAQRDVWNFFDFDEKWYQSSAFRVSMKIPILSGGERKAKVKQARIAYEKIEVLEKQLETQLKLQYNTKRNEYLNAFSVYLNKEKNRKVSEKIYLKTTEKFKEGMASSLDILNTQNQFLKSQSDYINATNALLKAGLELELILIDATENQ
jgi:outer membrane protein TolC